jgi:hypothetical protein
LDAAMSVWSVGRLQFEEDPRDVHIDGAFAEVDAVGDGPVLRQ